MGTFMSAVTTGDRFILPLILLPENNLSVYIDLQNLTHNPSISVQIALFQLFQHDEPALPCNDHPDAAGSGDSL
jgi:hypothetical protein